MAQVAGLRSAAYLSEKLPDKGVRNVNWLFTTNSSVFTHNRFLVKPEDFEGIKIRGLTPTFDTSLAAMGASPCPVPRSTRRSPPV